MMLGVGRFGQFSEDWQYGKKSICCVAQGNHIVAMAEAVINKHRME